MKAMKTWKKVVLSVFVICTIVVGGGFGYVFYQLSKIKTMSIPKTNKYLGIKDTAITKEEADNNIINIALFGVDRRAKTDASRSDSIIILSIDQNRKKIKMSSIMRDTYVTIENHGKTKLTHAYAYGGPALAIQTLNSNLNLNIRDYVTVDFFDFEKLIDAIGGVNINVNKDEITYINSYMTETAGIEKKSITKVTRPGFQRLNGLQAVAYSRIRYTSGDDFKRTERQRTVLEGLLIKIQSVGVGQFPSVVNKLLPFIETSMNSIDIMKLGTKVFASKTKTLEQARFPEDGYYTGKTINGIWYLVANMNSTIDQLHKFIYEDIKSGV